MCTVPVKDETIIYYTACNYIARSINGAQGDYKCKAFEYTVQL